MGESEDERRDLLQRCKVLHRVAPYVLKPAAGARRGRKLRSWVRSEHTDPRLVPWTAAEAAPTRVYVFWMSLFGKNSKYAGLAEGFFP